MVVVVVVNVLVLALAEVVVVPVQRADGKMTMLEHRIYLETRVGLQGEPKELVVRYLAEKNECVSNR